MISLWPRTVNTKSFTNLRRCKFILSLFVLFILSSCNALELLGQKQDIDSKYRKDSRPRHGILYFSCLPNGYSEPILCSFNSNGRIFKKYETSPGNGPYAPENLAWANGKLYFSGADTGYINREPHVLNPVTGTVQKMGELYSSNISSDPAGFVTYGSGVAFLANVEGNSSFCYSTNGLTISTGNCIGLSGNTISITAVVDGLMTQSGYYVCEDAIDVHQITALSTAPAVSSFGFSCSFKFRIDHRNKLIFPSSAASNVNYINFSNGSTGSFNTGFTTSDIKGVNHDGRVLIYDTSSAPINAHLFDSAGNSEFLYSSNNMPASDVIFSQDKMFWLELGQIMMLDLNGSSTPEQITDITGTSSDATRFFMTADGFYTIVPIAASEYNIWRTSLGGKDYGEGLIFTGTIDFVSELLFVPEGE